MGGASRRDLSEWLRVSESSRTPRTAAISGREGKIRRSSINIMEICYILGRFLFEDCRRRHGFPHAEISCLHAEIENLPAEKSFWQRVEEIVGRQKEKDCYDTYASDTFDSFVVTSKPKLLHIMPCAHPGLSSITEPPDQTEASFTST
jgi:hypothetical protein